jgi:hypothetical protein
MRLLTPTAATDSRSKSPSGRAGGVRGASNHRRPKCLLMPALGLMTSTPIATLLELADGLDDRAEAIALQLQLA